MEGPTHVWSMHNKSKTKLQRVTARSGQCFKNVIRTGYDYIPLSTLFMAFLS